jgi:S-adenosylmethionine hydrolase
MQHNSVITLTSDFGHKDPFVGIMKGVILNINPFVNIVDITHEISPQNILEAAITIEMSFETLSVVHITSEHYFMPDRSATFHGRDIFAPVAAWLSRGIDSSKFGDPINDYVSINVPVPIIQEENIVEGEVIYIDRFGNAATNIKAQTMENILKDKDGRRLKVLVKGKEAPFKNYYADAEDQGLYSLINSFGYLEFFVFRGNASLEFGIAVGEKVELILS